MQGSSPKPFAHKGKEEGKGTFGKRLKAERLRRGWKLVQFAEAAGVHHCQITSFENRGVMPSIKSLVAIAVLLECSTDYLLGLED
jgi:transcriptional regulator with XRE-family HTH domain